MSGRVWLVSKHVFPILKQVFVWVSCLRSCILLFSCVIRVYPCISLVFFYIFLILFFLHDLILQHLHICHGRFRFLEIFLRCLYNNFSLKTVGRMLIIPNHDRLPAQLFETAKNIFRAHHVHIRTFYIFDCLKYLCFAAIGSAACANCA